MLGDSRKSEALRAARRASERAATAFHADLKRNRQLTTVVSIGPWLGVLGTVLGIITPYRSGGERTAAMALLTALLGHALAPCAAGLLIAVIALWFYKYLLARIEDFDTDMRTASLDLMNALSRMP